MGTPFGSPSTDVGRTEDREESGRWPFASHDDSDRRSTADLYSDASSSALELPGFSCISDDKNIGGRQSPADPCYNAARTWGSKSSVFYSYTKQEETIAPTSYCSCLRPCLLMSFISCTTGQAHIVQYGGLDGRVHFNYGGLIKLGLMSVGATITVDA